MMNVSIPTVTALDSAASLLASLSDPKSAAERLEKLSAATIAYQEAKKSALEAKNSLASLEKDMTAREKSVGEREASVKAREESVTARENDFAELRKRIRAMYTQE